MATLRQTFTNIANAIREKNGSSDTYTPAEMPGAIRAISGGGTPSLQSKNATPTESAQTIVADSGYDGLSQVNISAISSTYVGSQIPINPTPTVSGATVTIPEGYYNAETIKSVNTTTHPNPTASISNAGLITASHTQTSGYVNAGTTTGTLQLTTKGATSITPTTSSQQAVAAKVYTTGAITVEPIPSQYIVTTDATATAEEIVSGKTAYVNGSKLIGTLVTQSYYTGSTSPSSSLGNDGDLYFQN